MKKLPEITIAFWIMKICATTLGETAGDLMSMTLKIGYGASSIILLFIFMVVLLGQLISKKYIPPLYWAVILATSTAGTTISDFMDRTLGLGYAKGSAILIILLLVVLFLWKKTESSLNVTTISSFRGEIFYWTAILFSNTLGTALGDFIADDTGLGFLGGAVLIATLLLVIGLSYYFLKVSHIALFWLAFILTRPFGATFGDLLTKPIQKGGLNLGTIGSSLVLFIILSSLIFFSIFKNSKHKINTI
ncbi:hypothetical protein [Flavobacterium sp. 140616W15]|uniref:COG4705 family protein n=1 Tax=Flavobacterium sp. 140616W15 TaxID=2478552 RepID=UPI000F0D11D1|nr:hypothetical protein [Flavobacterium sp. 140616W15]AYN04184.1 hypothetical protein EAG11_08260 [Flavobacterium sp. 140616W15]